MTVLPAASPRVLRDYQLEAGDAVLEEWGCGVRRTAVVLPTGSGKSSVVAYVAAHAYRLGLRIALLAHRGELLDQMADTVVAVAPDIPRPGIVRADRDEHAHPIVAASFQTLVSDRRRARVGARDVVLVDEVHHVSAPSYASVVESFGAEVFFAGFTATLRREDGRALREMIDSVAYSKTLRWAVDSGHLVRPTGITVAIPDLDLESVTVRAGDYASGELGRVMEAETPEVVRAILRHAHDRRPIIFAASVDAAHDIAASLDRAGMSAEAVTGAMSYDERQPVYDRYRSGGTRALVTVQVLTEGADFPMCDAAIIARPTQSQILYSQMVGRALRLHPGKTDALVLDLVGVARSLSLVKLADLDAGTVSKTVDTEGGEIPDDLDDVNPPPPAPTGPRVPEIRLGPIDTVGIDLLGPEDTSVLWLGTRGGVPFIPAAQGDDMAVFLWATGVGWRVGEMTTRGPKSGTWLADGRTLPLEVAREVALDWVADRGPVPRRGARWRQDAPPSDAQIRFARSLRITDPESMTKARLSDEISIALMSARLDGGN